MLAFFRNDMGFGGNNGLTDFKRCSASTSRRTATRGGLYIASASRRLALVFLALPRHRLARKLGRVLLAMRDAEARVRFLRLLRRTAKLFVFTLSAMIAGSPGALYVPQVGIINPERVLARQLDRDRDLGRGRRTRHAGRRHPRCRPRQRRQDLAHGAAPEAWLFVLGALFILVTLCLPEGHRRLRAAMAPLASSQGAKLMKAGDG